MLFQTTNSKDEDFFKTLHLKGQNAFPRITLGYLETIGLLIAPLEEDAGVAAVFGSYDMQPAARNFLSQYRNLLHYYVHQAGHGDACTFWAGCGAVRRSAFVDVGGFDESYGRPCVEDIELGMRLRSQGYGIRLNKNAQATHLKTWTLWSMVKADIFDRGVPWARLILQHKAMPNTLNLQHAQRWCVILAAILCMNLFVGIWFAPVLVIAIPLGVLLVVSLDVWSLRRRVPQLIKWACVCGVAGLAVYVGYLCPIGALSTSIPALGIVVVNRHLFATLIRNRSWHFAIAAIPLQLLFYLYAGFSFALGAAGHSLSSRTRPPIASASNRE